MENELNLVKDIIIELSSLGGWAILAYVVFMLMKAVVIWWPVFWLVHKIIVKVSLHFSQPLSQESKDKLEKTLKDLESELVGTQQERDEALRDKDNTLHKYRIMIDKLNHNKGD